MKDNLDLIQDETKKLKDIILDPTVRILPGQIAFFLILSIFPLLMLIGYLGSLFGVSIDTIINMIKNTFPEEVSKVISDVVSGKSFDSSVGISMITGIILASNGAHAITLASNALYGFPSNSFIRRRLKAFLMIFLLVFLFVFIVFVLGYGSLIYGVLKEALGLKGNWLYSLISIAKWPFAFLMMYVFIKLIYVIAPDWHILSSKTTKGALFTTVGWTIATAIFSFYVSHFANYDLFYGSLSNIVILMIWVYVLSFILVVGIAINVKQYNDVRE